MNPLYAIFKGISNLLLGGLGIIFFIILTIPTLMFFYAWIFYGVDEMIYFLKGLDGKSSSGLKEDEKIVVLNILEGRLREDEMRGIWNILEGRGRTRGNSKSKASEEPFGRLVGIFFLGCYLYTIFSLGYFLR